MVKKAETKAKIKGFFVDLIFCAASCLIGAMAVQWIMIPSGLTTGGVNGIVRIIMRITGCGFTAPYYIMAGAVVLTVWLTLGFKQVRRVLTLFALFPAFTWILSHWQITLVANHDLLLSSIFYGILMGISSALVFYRGYTYAGSDGLAKVVRKKLIPHVSQSTIMMIIDLVILLSSIPFYGTTIVMYAIINEVVCTETINMILYGFSSKIVQLQIITKYPDDIEKFILEEMGRGTSMHKVLGGYTHELRTEFRLLCSPRESIELRKKLAEIEPEAFVTLIRVDGVWGSGKGFSNIHDEDPDM